MAEAKKIILNIAHADQRGRYHVSRRDGERVVSDSETPIRDAASALRAPLRQA